MYNHYNNNDYLFSVFTLSINFCLSKSTTRAYSNNNNNTTLAIIVYHSYSNTVNRIIIKHCMAIVYIVMLFINIIGVSIVTMYKYGVGFL